MTLRRKTLFPYTRHLGHQAADFLHLLYRFHRFSLSMTAIILFTALLGEAGRDALMYGSKEIVSQGQIWRALTGHFVHSNFNHTLLNLAGLGLIAYLFERNAQARWWSALTLIMALLSSAGYLIFAPELHHYVGFSGVLHGLFLVAAISEWPKDRLLGGGLFVMVTFKLVHAQLFGTSDGTEALIGAPIAEQAHVIGSILGVALAIPFRRHLFLSWKSRAKDRKKAASEA
jgi:rhomboid family GlyGly-CTERM serine protease